MSGGSWFGAAEVGGSRLMQALVVDDSAVYRKLIGDHLRSWGFGVTLAETGSEAWRILEEPNAPKLVLLDWVLPDLDGIELCQRIRQAGSSSPYVYIILLTSKEGRQNMLQAMQAGADDYLVKPFDELELKARLLVGKRILDLQEELVSARESMRHTATDGDNGGWFRNVSEQGNYWHVCYRELLDRVRRGETDIVPTFIDDYLDQHGAHGQVNVRAGAWNTGWHHGAGF